ncbi:MAG: flagellar hook protein FlgE [Phyllobacterium sp.]
MGLYGMMRTGVSGMNAQANRLSTVADNIANSSTVGYKRASTQFSSLVLPSTGGNYNSGGVETDVRYHITDSGAIRYTTSTTDLAVSGNGFFVVSNANGTPYLTRAGAFVPDDEGNLINSAGNYLMGYPIVDGQTNAVVNGYQGLEKINVRQNDLLAVATSSGQFTANLNADADIVVGAIPAEYTYKSSLVAYDSLGKVRTLDVYFAKTAEGQWDVKVHENGAEVGATTLTFDGSGNLTSTGALALTIPNATGTGTQTIDLDLSGMKQLAADYTITTAKLNGSAPSAVDTVEIGADGKVVAIFENGSRRELYQLALATVPSPDKLSVLSGNIFTPSAESGDVQLGLPNSGSMGKIVSGALEESNADIAQELTDMIEAQRSYTANSKVFQTGSDLMDVLVNLKR